MSISSALSAVVMSFILREAPMLNQQPVRLADYVQGVSALVDVHDQVSDGRLINHDMDVLLLTAVNYRESRLKNPTVDGDCHSQAEGIGALPSASWPKGFVPKFKTVCNAVGPMQLSRTNLSGLAHWPEVRKDFGAERGWQESEMGWGAKTSNPFTVEELRDVKTNVRIAYGELEHWKNECRSSDKKEAPVGVWLTAYRYGHCPAKARSGRFYVDEEAKTRCALMNKMVENLTNDGTGLAAFRCTY